ncbi:hypothetical protein HPB47_012359 [Ixodes persulcatus]|uniref:Uncharacterized protein n=1 Tax=Ixodes persulcatus TaxID=34615 RepID=A0AC60NTN5_IXOPE|nr:hypothetical protein HPB47_012359 [Ixodes persulcatus]
MGRGSRNACAWCDAPRCPSVAGGTGALPTPSPPPPPPPIVAVPGGPPGPIWPRAEPPGTMAPAGAALLCLRRRPDSAVGRAGHFPGRRPTGVGTTAVRLCGAWSKLPMQGACNLGETNTSR